MRARILLVVLCACSPHETQAVEIPPPAASAAPAVTASASSAPVASTPPSPSCPSSYAASPRPTCRGGDDPGRCTYPEGTCSCGSPPMCGGAVRPPMPPSWICEAPRPPCPKAGTPCHGDAQCHDGACSWQGVVRCVHGVWTPVSVPPPP